MKFTWGTGIFIYIVLFVMICLAFIWYTTTLHINMVEEDYYPKELRHEEQLNKERNANALHERMQIAIKRDSLKLILPGEMHGKKLTGQIHIYRPSDETLDLLLPLRPDTAGMQSVSRARLAKGKYIVKVEWATVTTKYYEEQEIFIP